MKWIFGVLLGLAILCTYLSFPKDPHVECRESCFATYQQNSAKVQEYCKEQEDQPFGDFHCSVEASTATGVLEDCYNSCEMLP